MPWPAPPARDRVRLARILADLVFVTVDWLNLLAYPLLGELQRWSFMPAGMVDLLVEMEDRVPGRLHRLPAFRPIAVLSRRSI